jgi:PTS system mannitol-specific IIC component
MSAVLPDARVNKNLQGPGARARVQKFGGYLAGMIMPNIGAFIAWGLITALFIPTGWLPNATLAALVGPIITYLLPVLIGYTGGRMVHGQRGAVIGAIATMGVIVGTDVPMFLGAMIIGPLSAFLLKKLDKAIEGKVPTGFEMLIDNFSLGILGGIMAILGRLGIGPVVEVLVKWLGSGVQALVNAHLLPLASIFVEPAKVLFLNNAINHGVLSPLGAAQAQAAGKSILFMVESNPGPGLGLLLAFMFFGPIALRPSAPGAIIIQFLGGIHEIYFPYVLMKPKMILAVIAGGMSGLFVGSLLGAGLVAPASPGSIIAYFAVTPKDGYIPMLADVLVATAVSFAVASALFGFGHGAKAEAEAEAAAAAAAPEAPTLAWTPPGAAVAAGTSSVATATATRTINGRDVKRLVIACDAGMGSSVMVASAMKKKLAASGVEVTHTPVNGIPADAQLILCHSGLLDRAEAIAPKNAVIIPFDQYMGDPAFTRVENAIKNGESLES